MADFCTKCSDEMFGNEIKPDINVQAIFDELEPGYMRRVLCEGCGMASIVKHEDGRGEILSLPEDREAELLDSMPIEEYWNSKRSLKNG